MSRDLLLKFCYPIRISEMGKDRNVKFGVRIDRQAQKPKNAKVGQKGRGPHYMTYFYNFRTPLCRYGMCIARAFKFGTWIGRQAYKPKNAKVRQKGHGLRHVTYFIILGAALYLWNG